MKYYCLIFVLMQATICATTARVAVFCSADDKAPALYKNAAYDLGVSLAARSYGLITGGSNTGLMKEVVDGYVSNSSSTDSVHGVLPRALEKYHIEHPKIPTDNIWWVDTFGQRLEQFHALCDSVIILPGGYGTLHELLDFLVHNQFGLDNKHIIMLNINGFWSGLLKQFHEMNEQKLLSSAHLNALTIVESVSECIDVLDGNYRPAQQTIDAHYWK